MDEVITEHLNNMTIKPRPTSWFREVADDLGHSNTSNPKAAVRATISKGQVAASNDNVQGLQQQAAKEKTGGSNTERQKIDFEKYVPNPITDKIRGKVKEKIRSEVPKSVRWMGLEKTGIAKGKAKSKIRDKLPDVLKDRGIADYLVGKGPKVASLSKPVIQGQGCSPLGYCCPLCQ